MATSNSKRDEALKKWKECVQRWYPKVQQRAYFVPPVHMNKINYKTETIGADTVAVQEPPVKATQKGTEQISISDVQEDQAQQHILHCLHKFFQQNNQVVFVLSQLKFTAYLGEVCFAAAAQEFPRPVDLRSQNQDRGDFDFLFIHRHYGLVAFEVKSIGLLFSGKVADQPREDKAIVKRLQKAVSQLNKSRDMLQYLTRDLPQPPKVTTSLMLPYLTAERLRRVLTDNPLERQALCNCLGIPYREDPADLCLTLDRISNKERFWHVTDDVTQAMTRWWQLLTEKRGEDASMTDQLYEDLIARFAGPATTVEVFCPSALPRATKVVRSEGEAVSETAERYMDLVLSPEQIEILNSRERLVYLTGPPGTGKTVVLMLKAGQWLNEGHDVYVISTYSENAAVSFYLYEALSQKYSSKQGGKVHFIRTIDCPLPEACFLNSHACVIADEVDGTRFEDLYRAWQMQSKHLHMWAARIFHNYFPTDFTVKVLRTSLRSPACVTREVLTTISDNPSVQVDPYEENPYPHTDGPTTRELRHQGPGHDIAVKPDDCEMCGLQLADVFKELHVGESFAGTSLKGSPRALEYRDVFVLSTHLADTTTADSGLVRGLRKAGVPVKAYTGKDSYDDDAVKELATMTGPDAVVAASMRYVNGLERKVVAWVQTVNDDSLTEVWGRLFGYTRSSAQLIIKDADGPECAERAKGTLGAAEVFDNREVMEQIFQVLEDNITEEAVRDVNDVFKIDVTFNDKPQVETFYVNLKYDEDKIIRGEWPGQEPDLACRLTISSEDALRVLTEGDKAVVDMMARRQFHIVPSRTPATLQFASFLKRLFPYFKATLLKLRGETELKDH